MGVGSWILNTKHQAEDTFTDLLTVSKLISFTADHTMGRSNQPFVYVPHKRRGPISAEFKSPGPAAFNIPGTIGNHGPKESTKATAPAFTFGGKSELKNKFKTPAPNVYDTDKGENYLEGVKALSMGERLKEAKKFLTPAPNKYEAVIPEDKPSFAFGVKHSPHLYSGRELGRERFVATKTESVSNGHSNGDSGANGEFRQRSGTFTRDKPTVLSTVA